MKNLMTAAASMLLMLMLILQFSQNQMNYIRVTSAEQAVHNFKEVVKQEGCITGSNRLWIKNQLSAITGCSENQIIVSGTEEPVSRGQLIKYRVELPMTALVNQPTFWGMKQKNKERKYIVGQYATSEYLRW